MERSRCSISASFRNKCNRLLKLTYTAFLMGCAMMSASSFAPSLSGHDTLRTSAAFESSPSAKDSRGRISTKKWVLNGQCLLFAIQYVASINHGFQEFARPSYPPHAASRQWIATGDHCTVADSESSQARTAENINTRGVVFPVRWLHRQV